MGPIEIINTLNAKRAELLEGSDPSKDDAEYIFIDPDEYVKGTNRRLKRISGQLHQVEKGEYLKDCIEAFLLNVQALNAPDLINGYKEAKNLVSTKYGFGPVDDVYLTIGPMLRPKRYRIRISIRGADQESSELQDLASFSQSGKYVEVRSLQEFYNWYVKEFGEIVI